MSIMNSPTVVLLLLILTFCLNLPSVQSYVITPAALLPTHETEGDAIHGGNLFGSQPNAWLGKRGVTDCDGAGVFTCPIGTCYAGSDGFIGCCSVSSCAARTTCIEYNPRSKADCDPNTGGCVVCSKPELPFCATVYNQYSDQFIMFCATTNTKQYTQYAVANSDLPSLSTALPPDTTDSSTAAVRTKTIASVAPSTRIITTVITTVAPDDSETSMVVTVTETSVNVASATESAATSEGPESAGQSDTPWSSAEESNSGSSNMSVGAIVGIALGSAAAIAGTIALAWFCVKHHRNHNQNENSSSSSPPLWQGPASGPYNEVAQQPKIAELEDTSPVPTQGEWYTTPELDSAPASPANPPAPFTQTSVRKQHPASLTPGASISTLSAP